MQEAASSFETDFPETAGTYTVWPSLLGISMTFGPTVVREIGEVLGQESKGKRSN